MAKRKYLLHRNKNYFFCILYGFDIDTILKLDYRSFGLQAIKIFSPEFDLLSKHITSFPKILEEDFDLFKFYHAHDISLLFISEKEENIYDFYDFLRLLRPSKIDLWLTFSSTYINYEIEGKSFEEHQTSGYSTWTSIHQLYDQLLENDIFYLNKADTLFANKILKKYRELSKNPSYVKFMSLYRRAYHEEKDYFKFLLLFMIVESLIVDNETTGVVYKIRRLCAVVVGENLADCEMIYNKTKDAYNIRSKLVHSAKNEIANAKYLPFLHSLVSELGVMILICNLNIDELFTLANKLGFAQKKLLIGNRTFKPFKNFQKNWLNFHLLEKKKK